jgi:hypothetical protein
VCTALLQLILIEPSHRQFEEVLLAKAYADDDVPTVHLGPASVLYLTSSMMVSSLTVSYCLM